MKFREHSTPKQAEMQLAPMIDVVFLLLIFFIVSWNFARFEAEVNISVPEAKTAEQTPRTPGEIIINVTKDGDIKINSQILDQSELLEKLTRVAELFKDQPVILRGDRDANFAAVMVVLDTCQEAGIWNVAFAAEKPEQTTTRIPAPFREALTP